MKDVLLLQYLQNSARLIYKYMYIQAFNASISPSNIKLISAYRKNTFKIPKVC